jgi:hypothetical protein
MALVDNSLLAASLKENKMDFEKIFSLKVRDGFAAARRTMTPMGIDQKVSLKRDFLTNLTQPGRTGAINNSTDFISHKERIPELKPAKVDMYMDEVALYNLRVSFLNNLAPADVNDIYSIAGQEHIMGKVIGQIAKEVMAAVYKSALGYAASGNTTAFQGGLNLFDGLGVKFLTGYATSGTGWVGDIPGTNKVTAAGSLTESNVIAELKKMFELIYTTPHMYDVAISDAAEDENALIIPPAYFLAMVNALDALTYKSNQLVEQGLDGVYRFKALPNVKIKQETFMSGVDNMFWTPKANLFYLHSMASNDITSIKFLEQGRGVQILIDWEQNVDYADGRLIALYK